MIKGEHSSSIFESISAAGASMVNVPHADRDANATTVLLTLCDLFLEK